MPQYDNTNKGAGWIRTSKKGMQYINCKVNVFGKDVNISVFKNTKKQNAKQPDYNLVVSEPKTYTPQQAAQSLGDGFAPEAEMSDEIPF